MDEVLLERVLRCVEQVPAGRVVSYGDVAELVGTGPRQVGSIMRRWGGNVPWWRVTNAAGEFVDPDLMARARTHWRAEGIAVKPNGRGTRMADHRADLTRLEQDYVRATAGLEQPHTAG
ncbi:MGMT family protein [Ornithinimicrobium panacihumi]|uniref:MGMT family protein n=1 Tax=Ornithinimicrobium panacihumi TaxID=2008449 RepID=UPI003F8B3293